MTVYLDVILIENLCMNYIILFATGYIMKLKIKHLRIILSSAIGGVYAIISYMDIIPVYSTLIAKVILSISMVYIAYYPKNIKLCLKELLLFYLVSFVFGGCAFALLYIIKPQNILMKNGVYIGTYPIKVAIIGALVGFIITYLAFKLIKGRISKKNVFYEVTIIFKGKIVGVTAMLDTGNLLKDPISQMPVMLVQKDKLYKIIPKNILDSIEKALGGDDNIEIDTKERNEYFSRFRIIPFKSIGKQNGMLIGFKADKIKIDINDNVEDLKNIIIGIYNGKFSKSEKYSALIGLDILERGNENEFATNTKV